jgi:hypothetical protein
MELEQDDKDRIQMDQDDESELSEESYGTNWYHPTNTSILTMKKIKTP